MTFNKINTLPHVLAVLMCVGTTQYAVPSIAAPTLSLFWSATTGSGTVGGTTIDAAPGDVLTLNAVVNIDSLGFTGVAFDLIGSGVFAQSNLLVPGVGGPPECPIPPNFSLTCFSTTLKAFAPARLGVTDSGSNTTGYDVIGLTPEFVPSTITVGAGQFLVTANSGSVSTFFEPGVGGVTDGGFNFSVPSTSTITFTNPIPLPPAVWLFGSGLLGLISIAKRKKSA